MMLPAESRCQSVTRKLVMMRIKGLVPDVLVGSVKFLLSFPRSTIANIAWKSIRLQGLFNVIVRDSRSEMRRMMNDFKALVVNMDKLMDIVSLRWKSLSSAFIRLSKHFILVVPRVDVISSIDLMWLHLERHNQVAHYACLLKAKQAKCFSLEDWRDFDEL